VVLQLVNRQSHILTLS